MWGKKKDLPFGIAQRNPHLRYESTSTSKGKRKIKLYQVGVFIQVFWPPILIQLQQNTFDRFFLNTAWTKHVKTTMPTDTANI